MGNVINGVVVNMSLAVNELSFKQKFSSIYDAQRAYEDLILLLKNLHDKYDVSIRDICVLSIGSEFDVTEDVKFRQFLNKYIRDRDHRILLLSLFTSVLQEYHFDEVLFFNGELSEGASYVYSTKGVLISLQSLEIFKASLIDFCSGESEDKVISLRNIASKEQIDTHADYIVIRIYEPNPKHKSEGYFRSGSEYVSPMKLSKEEGQRVLNRAKEIKGKIYGVHDSSIYEFRRTLGCVYHGYDVTSSLDKVTKSNIYRSFEK